MPARSELFLNSAQQLRITGPTNTNDNSAMTGATATAVLLDEVSDQTLLAAAASSATTLFVKDASKYAAADTILTWLDTGAIHTTTVVSVDTALNTILLTAGLASAAALGKDVAKRIGAVITLTQYGTVFTPGLKDGSWGYRGVKTIAHVGLSLKQKVRIYFIFDDGSDTEMERELFCVVVR